MPDNEKLRYSMLIQWSSKDNAYLVILPEWQNEIQDVFAHGDTYEEAAKNGRECLEFLVKSGKELGEDLPEPNVHISDEEAKEIDKKWDKTKKSIPPGQRIIASAKDALAFAQGENNNCVVHNFYQENNNMQQDTNEQATQLSSNPFIAQRQQRYAKLSQWGLDEFESIMDRRAITNKAEQRIFDENITEDTEKQKVYDEVKAQYREYLEYLRKSSETKETRYETMTFQEMYDRIKIKEHKATSDEATEPFTGDITQHSEYIKGYNAYFKYQKEQQERRERPYDQGWMAAAQEALRNEALAIEAASEQSETSLPSDFMENNAIQRLRDEVKRLDERLRKLEKFTEE